MKPRRKHNGTICGCLGCQQLCQQVLGYLIPGDIGWIADHLEITPQQVEEYPEASLGAPVETSGSSALSRVPTIVLRGAAFGCILPDFYLPKIVSLPQSAPNLTQFSIEFVQ